MTDIPSSPDPRDGLPHGLVEACVKLLISVREGVAEMLDEARAGDDRALVALSKRTCELERALRNAIETERRFHEWQAKQAQDAKDTEIDFGEVRDQLERRLADLGSAGEAP